MAKDAKGHGSNPRGGGTDIIRSGGLRGVTIGANYQAASNKMRPDRDFKNDAERTVYDLRQRMANTGPGHSTGLMQGIKNLLRG